MAVWKDWVNWQYIVTPSKFSKSQIEAMGFTVKEVIPHQIPSIMPIDHEYGKTWRVKFPPNKKILLYNGSQILRKALPSLKLAIDMLSKKRDDFIMVYHTDKQNMPFHTPIWELNGKNSVIETDFPHLPILQVYAKMNYADIIVHPAVVEGFGLPVLETLNLGKPLVCINAPGVNEIANSKNSFMVQNVIRTTLKWQNYINFPVVEYKPDDLANEIENALDAKPETLEEKKIAGLETAKRYYNTYKRFTEI
jgi:glycosyltransferase involved in cell wall biosynthesis